LCNISSVSFSNLSSFVVNAAVVVVAILDEEVVTVVVVLLVLEEIEIDVGTFVSS
jgi:hypothetical protein